MLGLVFLFVALSFGSTTFLLDFDPSRACGVSACANSGNSDIDQSYGDIAGLLDVQYNGNVSPTTRGTVASQGDNMNYWNTGYSSLSNVAYGSSGQMAQILLSGQVTLTSFQLGAYSNGACDVAVLDLDQAIGNRTVYQSLAIQVSTAVTVSGPWSSNTGIAIQVGPDIYNIAIDNIDFTIPADVTTTSTAAPTTTTTTTTAAPTTTTAIPTTTIANTNPVVLDFSSATCGGSTCSNFAVIDQSYGDSPFLDVIYTAGLSAGSAGTIAPEGTGLFWFNANGGSAYGPSSTMQQIHFRGEVTLHGFKLIGDGSGSCEFRVIDAANGTVIYSQSGIAVASGATVQISGLWYSSVGLVLQVGPDLYNIVIDDIALSVGNTQTIAPSTTTTVTTTSTTTVATSSTSTVSSTTPLTTTPSAPPPPSIVGNVFFWDATTLGRTLRNFQVPSFVVGNYKACFMDIGSDLSSEIFKVRVDGVEIPLVTFEHHGPNGALRTMVSFFYVTTGTQSRVNVDYDEGLAYCVEIAGSTGLDSFVSSGTRILQRALSKTLEPQCESLLMITASFNSTLNPVDQTRPSIFMPNIFPGIRINTGVDQDKGLISRIFRYTNDPYRVEVQYLGTLSPNNGATFAMSALAFGSCPSFASSCSGPTCVCTGRFCQSTEALTIAGLAVSPASSLLAPKITLNDTIHSATLDVARVPPIIVTHGGGGGMALSGQLVLSVNALVPRSAPLVIASAQGDSIIQGTFSSIAVVSDTPCETVTATPTYDLTSLSVSLDSSATPGCDPSQFSGDTLGTGAIVGIAVGAVVGGAAIGLGIVLLSKYVIQQKTITATQALKDKEMTGLSTFNYQAYN